MSVETYYEARGVAVHHGDCLDVLRSLPDASVDAVVTDPPYGLEFMGKEWDAPWKAEGTHWREASRLPGSHSTNPTPRPQNFGVAGLPFQEWCEAWSRECLRVLKPGGHMLAFGGTRTWHRLACAVEDAGFEIRDSIAWMYGSGFPKSLDVSKAIDKAAGAEREVVGTKLGLPGYSLAPSKGSGDLHFGGFGGDGDPEREAQITAPATPDAERWQGWGTALKPAFEPVVVARKPLAGTVAANVLEHGTGALNIDGCRILTGDDLGGGGSGTGRVGAYLLGGYPDLNALRVGALTDEVTPDGKNRARAVLARALATDNTRLSAERGGRWPANVVLDESHEPVLRLRYNLPTEVERTIRESFGARTDHLPAVRDTRDGAAEQGKASEVLLPQVPSGVDVGEPDGRARSEVGQAAHAGNSGADLGDQEGQPPHGREGRELEGRALPQSGVRLREVVDAPAERAGDLRADGDPQRRDLHTGAPASRGAATRAGADLRGDRASRERTQGGQPAGEPGIPRVQQLAPDEARRGRRGDVQAATGERGAAGAPLEVLRRECPPGWWHYFEVVGHRREGQAAALDEQSGESRSTASVRKRAGGSVGNGETLNRYAIHEDNVGGYADQGSASRFFYVAKADASERVRVNGTAHPTVKPLALMRWLVRLVTPPGGTVLEPFAGSGATVEACLLEGFHCIAIEREADYLPLIRQRINRRRDPVEAVKAAGEDGGLFDLLGEEGA